MKKLAIGCGVIVLLGCLALGVPLLLASGSPAPAAAGAPFDGDDDTDGIEADDEFDRRWNALSERIDAAANDGDWQQVEANLAELGEMGVHVMSIACEDCGPVAEIADRCPLCDAAGPLRPRP